MKNLSELSEDEKLEAYKQYAENKEARKGLEHIDKIRPLLINQCVISFVDKNGEKRYKLDAGRMIQLFEAHVTTSPVVFKVGGRYAEMIELDGYTPPVGQ